jgi:hypothetical protein
VVFFLEEKWRTLEVVDLGQIKSDLGHIKSDPGQIKSDLDGRSRSFFFKSKENPKAKESKKNVLRRASFSEI